MILPDTSPIPDWILELIRIAPQEHESCSSEPHARQRLADLQNALLNPDILYALCRIACAVFEVGASVDIQSFEGYHDLLNQQQLIGEKRGLRRFLVELHEIRVKLQDQIIH